MVVPWFIGQYQHSIDAKNRLFIPAAFREKLAAEKATAFILSTGFSQWENLLSEKISVINLPDKELERAFKRKFFAGACEVPVDPQGRILVPQSSKAYAGLKKEVYVQGANTRIELWDEARWKQYSQKKIQPSLKKFEKVLEI